MSDKIEKDGDGFEVHRMDDPGVSVTHEMPAEADKTSNPIPNDAEINQAPVRSGRPDLPIAQVLGSGAGAHEVVQDPHLGNDGRWYPDENDAAEQRGELVPEPAVDPDAEPKKRASSKASSSKSSTKASAKPSDSAAAVKDKSGEDAK